MQTRLETHNRHPVLSGRISSIISTYFIKDNCAPWQEYINGLLQYCSISIANAPEILQSCTKPLIFQWLFQFLRILNFVGAFIMGLIRTDWFSFFVEPQLWSTSTPPSSDFPLTHWGRDKMAAISHAFSWMKMFEFRLKFHWSLFLRFQLTIFQHWLRLWLGADHATSHYLNQWWLDYRRIYIYASLGLNELSGCVQATDTVYMITRN